MTAFDDSFTALMGNEGGYSFNPADPGGETMWGITARVAKAAGYTGAMKDLPQATAKQIAKTNYWDAVRGDELEPHIAFQAFDAAYNSGVGQSIKWLQQSAGVAADGSFGPATMAAIEATDWWRIVIRFNAYRLQMLRSLATWPTFGKGWTGRVADNLMRGSV